MDWTFADVWEIVAEVLPDAPAQVQGDRRLTWSAFDRRADGVATTLLGAGLARQDKVAQYLHNCPEYLESVAAAFKAGLVPVNTNYRYLDDELVYVWDNSDTIAVVFHGAFADTVERIRPRVPRVRLWLHVDDGTGPCPAWALPYEEAAATGGQHVRGPWGRTGDDLYLLYTGGTTGAPKGVMWRQEDLFLTANRTQRVKYPLDATPEKIAALLTKPGPRHVPVCPLMHGIGSVTSFQAMSSGGCIVTLPGRRYDAVDLLDTIERDQVSTIALVGDVMTRPLLEVLDAEPGRWDLSSLRMISSSGAMWSASVKEGLLRHSERLILIDTLGSSESIGMASALTTSAGTNQTARFQIGADTRVVTDDGRFVEPGSGEEGMLAKRGNTSIGYYKDATKTDTSYRTIGGERWIVPGDMATVETDGTIVLLGRGSGCINTGGEKVFPEEVEEALKQHPAVRDAAVVGVPDERFGEAIVAVIEPEDGARPDPDELVAHVKANLAAYKAPKRVLVVPALDRAVTGKTDYKRWKAYATDAVTTT